MNIGKTIQLDSARITGIGTYCPTTKISNDFFSDRFTAKEISNIEKMAGVRSRFWVESESTSDLCIEAARPVLEKLAWKPDSIDAVIFVTQSPDYVLPASSIRIAKALQLSDGIIAFDVNLGCSGYPYGLYLATSLISTGAAKRVLLAAGETASKIIDKHDRSTAMIFGDGGSATFIEADPTSQSTFTLGTDHSGLTHLIVPNSRFGVNPVANDPRLAGKNPDYIFMDGGEVFNFTLQRVPALVEQTRQRAQRDIDYYLFHQANSFMLNHLMKKMKLAPDIAPSNIEEFGNTSSASIPLLITTRLRALIQQQATHTTLGMFGFGVGYSWASAVTTLNQETIILHSGGHNEKQ